MRHLVFATLAIIGCGSTIEVPGGTTCRDYCGTLTDMVGRCVKAFGEDYDLPRECAAGALPDDCKSLTGFSPGLYSDCSSPARELFCCKGEPNASSGSTGSGSSSETTTTGEPPKSHCGCQSPQTCVGDEKYQSLSTWCNAVDGNKPVAELCALSESCPDRACFELPMVAPLQCADASEAHVFCCPN